MEVEDGSNDDCDKVTDHEVLWFDDKQHHKKNICFIFIFLWKKGFQPSQLQFRSSNASLM